jgi:hypothetical protein
MLGGILHPTHFPLMHLTNLLSNADRHIQAETATEQTFQCSEKEKRKTIIPNIFREHNTGLHGRFSQSKEKEQVCKSLTFSQSNIPKTFEETLHKWLRCHQFFVSDKINRLIYSAHRPGEKQ